MTQAEFYVKHPHLPEYVHTVIDHLAMGQMPEQASIWFEFISRDTSENIIALVDDMMERIPEYWAKQGITKSA